MSRNIIVNKQQQSSVTPTPTTTNVRSYTTQAQRLLQQQQQEAETQPAVGFKRDQLYRMMDKFYHTLAEGVSDDSFSIASQIFFQLNPYLEKKEHDSLGEAWRDLYADSDGSAITSLKKTVDGIKVRFA